MNMERLEAEVVIVGGGPVGMGLAIELGQRGVDCIVVERYPEPQPIPKGQNLTQRTMEHFHAWGVEDRVRAARTIPPEYGIGGLTAYGTLLGEYQHDWLQRSLVAPFYSQRNERLPQYATEAALRSRVAELASVRTLFGWTAESLAQDDEGVTLELVERHGTTRRTVRAAYAVGCDGSRSVTRQAAGITQTFSEHDRLMALLVFRSQGLHELLKRYPGKSYYCVLQPELEGYWKFFGRVDLGHQWFFHAPVPVGTTKDNFDFRRYLFEAVGAEFDVDFDHIGFWDLRFALADRYRAGRVFIAGDAAHSHPPYGGYGVNSGLEDARNLGWKLAAALRGWAGPKLLDSYERERRAVFSSTIDDFIAKAIAIDRDFLKRFDPAVDRAAFEKAWGARTSDAVAEVNSFEPNYEDGGSAMGSHVFTARAGHHLAPAETADGNVVDHLGEGFTLLAFDAEVPADLPLEIVHLPRTGEALRYEASLVLVRPDGFVAWAGDDPEQVGPALRQAAGGA